MSKPLLALYIIFEDASISHLIVCRVESGIAHCSKISRDGQKSRVIEEFATNATIPQNVLGNVIADEAKSGEHPTRVQLMPQHLDQLIFLLVFKSVCLFELLMFGVEQYIKVDFFAKHVFCGKGPCRRAQHRRPHWRPCLSITARLGS